MTRALISWLPRELENQPQDSHQLSLESYRAPLSQSDFPPKPKPSTLQHPIPTADAPSRDHDLVARSILVI